MQLAFLFLCFSAVSASKVLISYLLLIKDNALGIKCGDPYVLTINKATVDSSCVPNTINQTFNSLYFFPNVPLSLGIGAVSFQLSTPQYALDGSIVSLPMNEDTGPVQFPVTVTVETTTSKPTQKPVTTTSPKSTIVTTTKLPKSTTAPRPVPTSALCVAYCTQILDQKVEKPPSTSSNTAAVVVAVIEGLALLAIILAFGYYKLRQSRMRDVNDFQMH